MTQFTMDENQFLKNLKFSWLNDLQSAKNEIYKQIGNVN